MDISKIFPQILSMSHYGSTKSMEQFPKVQQEVGHSPKLWRPQRKE